MHVMKHMLVSLEISTPVATAYRDSREHGMSSESSHYEVEYHFDEEINKFIQERSISYSKLLDQEVKDG